MNSELPLVIGISGASGAPIAVAALKALQTAKVPVLLVVSHGGAAVLKEEAGLTVADLAPYVRVTYEESDIAAPIASGSRRTRGMAIVPCSSNTVAHVALGLGNNLLTRAAHVHLKERRPLVIVPRETPLSTLDLRYLTTLSELGVVVLDAAPPYYLGIDRLSEAAEYLAGKLLDQFGVPHRLYRGWKEDA